MPVGESEFAGIKRSVFSSPATSKEYVQGKDTGPFFSRVVFVYFPGNLACSRQAQMLAILRQAHDFQKIIVNAEQDDDLRSFMPALKTALKESCFCLEPRPLSARFFAEQTEKPLADPQVCVQPDNAHGGLIVVGSHVQKTTRRLEALVAILS